MRRHPLAIVGILIAALVGCVSPVRGGGSAEPGDPGVNSPEQPPTRFTIVPDDYHVPYAGTTEDGRKFFLSDALFDFAKPGESGLGYVGLYLWNADGSFSEVRVDPVRRRGGLPPGQASSAGAQGLVEKRLAELGDFKLEPITVAPFLTTVDGVEFGWEVSEFDGEYTITIAPGDFIAYYAPWDGLGYDT